MRKLFLIILLFSFGQAFATDYYFANAGNDVSGAGTIGSPWQTITKLNSIYSTLSSGDSVLFKAGDTFTGSITVNKAGVIISRYGTGADPIVTGFYTIPAWTNVGTNLWESTAAVSTLPTCKIISINGANIAKGRTPNTGYWSIISRATNSITDGTHLNAAVTNWTGATLVVRKYRWIMDNFVITSASGGTLNFTNSGDATQVGYGYFIQDDPRTLDQTNEWSYNTTTKKITIYSTGSPSAVIKVPAAENGIDMNGFNTTTVDNINFIGFNSYGVYAPANDNVTVKNCTITMVGITGIFQYVSGQDASNCTIQGNTITDIGSMGIHAGYSPNSTITSNNVQRVGRYPGMGGNGDVSYCGIVNWGDNQITTYNTVRAAGYCGIRFDGNSALIQGNFVDSTNFTKDDGGGIYVYPQQTGPSDTVTYTTRTVRDNIVINTLGAIAGGEPSSDHSEGYAIYNDGTSPDVDYSNNTVSSAEYGIFFNSGKRITIDSNIVYDCVRGLYLKNYNGFGVENFTVRYNQFVAKEASQYAAYYEPGAATMPASFDADYNVYARPVDDDNCIWYDASGTNFYVTLAQWKASAFASGEDANSTKSPIAIANSTLFNFQYNNTNTEVVKTLGGTYIDLLGVTHAGYTTLEPYQSFLGLYLDSYNPVIILNNTKVIKE